MRVSDLEVRNNVVLFGHPLTAHTLATAVLRPVGAGLDPFCVAVAAQSQHYLFVRLRVLPAPVAQLLGVDFGAAGLTVLALHLARLRTNDGRHLGGVAEQPFQFDDSRDELFVLVLDPLPFQRCEPAELHVQDGLGLDFGQGELGHQVAAGVYDVGRSADELDDAVHIFDGDAQPFKHMDSRPRLSEVELGPAPHDLFAKFDVVAQGLLQREYPRHSADEADHVHRERVAERRVLVQVVEHHRHRCAAAELKHHPHAVPVRFVPDLGDAFDAAALDELSDAGDHIGLVDLERNFREHKPLTVLAGHFLKFMSGLHHHPATPGGIGVANPL